MIPKTLRAHAVHFASLGWRVFPLAPKTKRPLFPKCPKNLAHEAAGEEETCRGQECGQLTGHGVYDATCDLQIVDAWWEAHPNANIGLHTGPGSGVVVLDVDLGAPKPPKHRPDLPCITGPEAISHLAGQGHVLPSTMETKTGSGGRQLFFLPPRERAFPNRVKMMLGPDGPKTGLDTRGEGGFVVLPPSIHPNGTPYTWVDEMAPADCPSWLLDLVDPPRPAAPTPAPRDTFGSAGDDSRERKYVLKALENAVATVRGSSSDLAHDAVNLAAFQLGQLIGAGLPLSEDEASAPLIEAGLAAYGEKAAKKAREVRRTVRDGLKKGQENPKPWPPEGWDRPLEKRGDLPPPPGDADAPPDLEIRNRRAQLHVAPPPPAPRETDDPGPWEEEEGEIPFGGPDDEPLPAAAAETGRGAKAVVDLDDLRREAGWTQGTSALKPGARFDGLPRIQVTQRQAADVIDDAWSALLHARALPPLFVTNGRISQLRTFDDRVVIEEASPVHVQARLIRAARWMKTRKAAKGEVTKNQYVEVDAEGPPDFIAKDMVASPAPGLPRLDQIVYGPIFSAAGNLLGDAGYHAEERVWYEESRPCTPVPLTPEEARDTLFDWLADFPFQKDSDRAAALSLFLLPFARRFIDGPTPIHLFDAPQHGTGKSLLAEIILTAAMGRTPAMSPFDRKEEEVKKTITTVLLEGRPVVVFDNVSGTMDSPSLALATSGTRYADRVLGVSGGIDVPVWTIWVVTSNNAQMSFELARRTQRCRLARLDGSDFDPETARHPDIRGWTIANHSRLVSAALVLVHHWLQEGRPSASKRHAFASYERWASVMGGILEAAGVPGFLDDRDEFRKNADPATAEWTAFVSEWARFRGSRPTFTKRLLGIAQARELISFAWAHASTDASRLNAFGRHLAARRDQVFNVADDGKPPRKLAIRLGTNREGKARYHLEPIASGDRLPYGEDPNDRANGDDPGGGLL